LPAAVATIAASLLAASQVRAVTVPEQEAANDVCPGQSVSCGTFIQPAALDDGFDMDHYYFFVTAGTPITVGTDDPGGYPYTDTTIELFNASCNQMLASDANSGPRSYSVIYGYTAPATGVYVLRIHGAYSSEPQPYMAFIYCGTPPTGACCLASGECVLRDRVQCANLGGLYHGDGTACGSVSCPLPPENDRCENAIVIPTPGQGVLDGNAFFAMDDYDPWYPSCTGEYAEGRDVVFRLDLEDGDLVDLRYTQAGADASIYLATDCADVTASCVAGMDATGYGQPEVLRHIVGTPVPGACCYQDYACVVLAEQPCLESGGLWRGVWTTCEPNYCSLFHGACCLPDGDCLDSDPWECAQLGGDYVGDGTMCYWQPCPRPPGACCFEEGPCVWLPGQECTLQGGYWLGEGTPCEPDPCTSSFGACCYPDGTCRVRSPEDCAAQAGEYQGDFVRCEENDCGIPVGACCFMHGYCWILTQQQCLDYDGGWMGSELSCSPNPCPNSPRIEHPRAQTYYVILDARVDATGGPWTLEYSVLSAASAPEHGAGTARLGSVAASPNPFRASTRITWAIGPEGRGVIRLEIFDAAGRLVRRLRAAESGQAEAVWDGRNEHGERSPSGAYFLRLATDAGAIGRVLVFLE
jgi:hypothetical protein